MTSQLTWTAPLSVAARWQHLAALTGARAPTTPAAPLHRPVCMYTFATRMTTLRTLRPGGSRLRRCSWWVPAVRGANHFFCPDAHPYVRRCSWWVKVVRGKRFFFVKYGSPSDGSTLSGGGIIILRVVRRHFLVAVVDPAVSLSTYSPCPMEAVP